MNKLLSNPWVKGALTVLVTIAIVKLVAPKLPLPDAVKKLLPS